MASLGFNRYRGGQSRWHNAKTGRRGRIWEESFGSVVVEEEGRALRTMAACIDLNPVRAGMVADSADYHWSGYAEAMAGKACLKRSGQGQGTCDEASLADEVASIFCAQRRDTCG